MSLSVYPGKSRAEFEAIYPTLILPNSLNAHGWWNRPFEAKDARAGRAERFVQELLARHGNTPDRVAVISHGNFYRYTLAAILPMPDPDNYFFALNIRPLRTSTLAKAVKPKHTRPSCISIAPIICPTNCSRSSCQFGQHQLIGKSCAFVIHGVGFLHDKFHFVGIRWIVHLWPVGLR